MPALPLSGASEPTKVLSRWTAKPPSSLVSLHHREGSGSVAGMKLEKDEEGWRTHRGFLTCRGHRPQGVGVS